MKIRAIAAIAALALIATACGGGDDAAASGVISVEDLATETVGAATVNGSVDQTDAEASTLTDEEQVLAFAQCLRDEGLDVEDPTVNSDGSVDLRSIFRSAAGQGGEDAEPGQGGPPEGFREAFDACGDLVEDLQLGRRADIDDTELQDNLLEYARCMRDNGYDMADPDFSTDAPGPGGPFGDIDRSDPAFQEASEQCSDILAGFGPGGGAGPAGAGPAGAGPAGGSDNGGVAP